MSISAKLGALITEVNPTQEDLALTYLTQSSLKFKKIVNDCYGVEKITTSSGYEILLFMHGFETERVELSFFNQSKIWSQFKDYQQAFHEYQGMVKNQSLASSLEKLRNIDPYLINEERFNVNDWLITKCLKIVFYEICRQIANGTKIDRYVGRVAALGAMQKREQATQKVLNLFPKFFATLEPPTTLWEVNQLLERCSGNSKLEKRRDWYENHLRFCVDPNLGYLMRRKLTQPVKVFEPAVKPAKEVATNRVQSDLVTQWAGDEGAMIIKMITKATLMNKKLENIVNEKLLPLDQIDLIEQHIDSPYIYDITFKSSLVGSTDFVEKEGWGDMVHSRMLMSKKVTVHFDPLKNSISFLKDGFQMGLHLEDFSFLYKKMSYMEGTGLLTFLKYHGYMSPLGYLNHPMHLATTVNRVTVLGENELGLSIEIHDANDISLPLSGEYPKEGCLSSLKDHLNFITLTAPELETTFKHMEWKAASQ